MAARQPLPNSAYVKVEIDFTSDWNNPLAYTDVTDDLRLGTGLTWSRGRSDEFQVVSPGSASFTLNNRARAYDPTTNANMVPARPGRITCYYPTTATAYQQIDLSVEDWTPAWTIDHDAVVQVDAIERYGALGFANAASMGWLQQAAVARLNAMADAVNWPTAARSFQTGTWQLEVETTKDTDMLSAMGAVAASQGHILYESRTGVLTTKGEFATTSANLGTFGDGAGELDFVDIEDGVGGGYWYTRLHLTFAGAQWAQGADNTITKNVGGSYTTTKYGIRTLDRELSALTQANANTMATALASSLAGLPGYRVKSLQIRPLGDPTNLFPVVLNADLGNPITVKFQPAGGGARITQNATIRSIRHEIGETDWLVTWELSP